MVDDLARLQGAAGLPGFPPGAESLLPPYPASLLNPPSLSSHKSSKCKYPKKVSFSLFYKKIRYLLRNATLLIIFEIRSNVKIFLKKGI